MSVYIRLLSTYRPLSEDRDRAVPGIGTMVAGRVTAGTPGLWQKQQITGAGTSARLRA
jgi:hypothetical protein